MIRLEGVSKRYGCVEALRPLDLEVRRNEWLGLFGHNGSGKTTLIRILLGLSRPGTGRVLLDGAVPGPAQWRAFRRRLGFMPERVVFWEHLTGEETLRYFLRLRGADPAGATSALERVGLGAAARRQVGEYSKGMRQRLNLAQALLGEPAVLVLDEPIEGLDPQGVREFFELVRAGGVGTVVLSSHRLSEVCGKVDRICILEQGDVKSIGTVEELLRRSRLPVRVHIYPAGSTNGTLQAALDQLGATEVVQSAEALVAVVPQAEKTAFLFGLHAHRALIRDVRVEEPRLEEVYLENR